MEGPEQLVLMASAARRHYLEGASKIEIAEALGVSRFQVARLLERAIATGMVTIRVETPTGIDVALSDELRRRFGLKHSLVVVAGDHDPAAVAGTVGRAAAGLLAETVGSQDVIGLAWSRAVAVMSSAVDRLPVCPVVQLTGVLPRVDAGDTTTDIVRNVARIGGGPAFVFHAPMIVGDPETAASLRKQPEIARAFAKARDVTIAVVAVGSLHPPSSTVADSISRAELARLAKDNVCAEVSGTFVTGEGRAVTPPLADRMICLSPKQLRAIPTVIALAYGEERAGALRAAIEAGVVHGVVTHQELALALIEAAEEGPRR